ncbi:hypothetical protein HK096_009416, partial [Nowakowskiella sp. JEL0078]
KPMIRLALANFEEEHGTVDSAREVYHGLLEAIPGHAETILKFAHFEKRHGDESKFIDIIRTKGEFADGKTKGFLEAQIARYEYMVKGDIENARNIFSEAVSKHTHSKFLILSYLNFEIAQCNNLQFSTANVDQVWEMAQTGESLSNSDKQTIAYRVLDFKIDRGANIQTINKIERQIFDYGKREALEVAASESKKRRFEEEEREKPAKLARQGTPEVTLQLALGTATLQGDGSVQQQQPQTQQIPSAGYYAPQAAPTAAAAPWGAAAGYGAYGAQYGGYYGGAWDYSQAAYPQQ